jgi:hypothetical protein
MIDIINVALGGLMVIVLATGPKDRGLKPGQEQCVLKAVNIRSMTSLGEEVA